MEYLHSSDQADPLIDSLKRTNVMQGSGQLNADINAIDELVEEENLETTRK